MIRWLINHLLFAGTSFFAAGASTTGGGTGATTPPGGAGAGTGSDSGGGKAITGTSGAGDGSTGLQTGGDGDSGASLDGAEADFGDFSDQDFETEGDTDLQAGSREEFGSETYQQLKKALQAQPELFKTVKKAVSMVKRFQEHFETPEKAAELLSDIQTFGGWDTIKQDMGETATFLSGFNAGDAEVVNRWLDDNVDGLAKNMPTILKKWQSVDETGWAHDAAQTFMATMLQPSEATGLSPIAALNQLAQIEGVKDSDAFKTLVERINGVKAQAARAPEKQAAQPDTSKLTAREQVLKQQEAALYKQGLAGKANPILQSGAKNALKIVAGNTKLSSQAQQDLIGDIHREFAQLMAKDADGSKKRQALIQAGQTEQWLKMVKSAADRMMPLAARRVWRKYAGITGMSTRQKQERKAEGQQRRESGAGASAGQGLQTLSPGDGRQVDWDAMRAKFGGRDKADEIFAFGLKGVHGGKRVWIKKGDQNTVYTY
jgi:hypothetical protein